jgi:Anti-sigma-K factor rskA
MTLTHEELRSLLAASALNALPDDEAELLERHLQRCSHCRAELMEFQGTASVLAPTASDDPPIGLWEEISATIGKSPADEMPISLRRVVRRRSRWVQGWTLVATGAVAAAAVLAVWAVDLHGQVGRLQNPSAQTQLSSAVSSALAAPNHQVVILRSNQGTELASAVITTSGTAYLVPKALESLASADTYQLWAESRGKAVSLGVLGPTPGIAVFRFEQQMTSLMLTAEPSGGVPAPTSAVLASGVVSVAT